MHHVSVCHTKSALIRHVALADYFITKAVQYQCYYLNPLCSSMILSAQKFIVTI